MAFPLEIRQLIWQVLLTILDIMSLRRNYQGVKMWMFLILEPAKLLGACKPGSRARMDSRTGHATVLSFILEVRFIQVETSHC